MVDELNESCRLRDKYLALRKMEKKDSAREARRRQVEDICNLATLVSLHGTPAYCPSVRAHQVRAYTLATERRDRPLTWEALEDLGICHEDIRKYFGNPPHLYER